MFKQMAEVLRRADMFESHHVQKEKLSTRERMSEVLARLSPNRFTPFVSQLPPSLQVAPRR